MVVERCQKYISIWRTTTLHTKKVLRSTFIHAGKTTKDCIQFLNDPPMYMMWYNNSQRDESTLTLENCDLEFRSGWGVQHYVIKFVSDLRTGRWFSPGPPVSSTNKTYHHYITEILLKVTSITIKQTKTYFSMSLKISASISGMLTSPVSAIGPSSIL